MCSKIQNRICAIHFFIFGTETKIQFFSQMIIKIKKITIKDFKEEAEEEKVCVSLWSFECDFSFQSK